MSRISINDVWGNIGEKKTYGKLTGMNKNNKKIFKSNRNQDEYFKPR
jgi:hypothetical protein